MKAITPIIGIIILLLIVVALAGSAYTFIFGIAGSQMSNTIQVSPGSADENTIILTNLGTDPLQFSDLSVTVEGEEATIINTGSLEPRSNTILAFCSPARGNNLDVRVAGPSNSITYKANINQNINYYRVFVSSHTNNGNMGGLSGADQICQDNATTAGLGGTWKAWLSDSTTSASDRLYHSPSPYVLINCTRIADNWDDLTDGDIQNPINLYENGGTFADTGAFTYTNASGSALVSGSHCSDWTSSAASGAEIGDPTTTTSGWSHFASGFCNTNQNIYCFEQPS